MPAIAAACAALVLLSSCTGDDSSGDEEGRARIDEGLAAIYAGDHPSDEDAAAGECFADELSDVTEDQLRDAGVVDGSGDVVADLPPLDADLAQTWVSAQLACADFVEASTRAQQRVTKGKIDAGKYAGCLRDELSEEQVRDALVATMRSEFGDPAVAALAAAQDTCSREATPAD
jgi:hypothetical protein